MKAVLTRTGDYFVKFRDRTGRAREAQADLFVSVHADAFMDRSVRGSSENWSFASTVWPFASPGPPFVSFAL